MREVKDSIVVYGNERYVYSIVVTDEHGGWLWSAYDPDGAYLYGENYDPDQTNPWDEGNMFCDDHCKSNY